MGCTIDCETADDSPVQGQLMTLINQVLRRPTLMIVAL